MKKFKYSAYLIKNSNRKKISGTFYAENEAHLRKLLSDQDTFLISSKVISDKTPNMFFSLSGKIKIEELNSFSRQLSIMISSSIELINCLDVLRKQNFSKYFKQVLNIVYQDVKSGMLLSQAMQKHKKIFPEFFRDMVYIGEMSSSLEKVLKNVADYYENEEKNRRSIKAAMMYPIVLGCLLVGIVALLVAVVVPTFKESFAQINVEMPALTMAIFDISEFFIANWHYVLGGIFALIVIIKIIGKTKRGRYFYDKFYVKFKLTRGYQVAKVTSKFSRSFGILIQSGMNLVDSLEAITRIINNKYIQRKFKTAVEDVKKGVSLTVALEKMKTFPNMLIQMIGIGEKTAKLDEVMLLSCDYFDEQLASAIKSLTSVIQPVLMLFMGVIVGVIFIAVYSPMLSVMNQIA